MEKYPQWPMLGGARGVECLLAPPNYNYPVGTVFGIRYLFVISPAFVFRCRIAGAGGYALRRID
jgi:hypothetical protein